MCVKYKTSFLYLKAYTWYLVPCYDAIPLIKKTLISYRILERLDALHLTMKNIICFKNFLVLSRYGPKLSRVQLLSLIRVEIKSNYLEINSGVFFPFD